MEDKWVLPTYFHIQYLLQGASYYISVGVVHHCSNVKREKVKLSWKSQNLFTRRTIICIRVDDGIGFHGSLSVRHHQWKKEEIYIFSFLLIKKPTEEGFFDVRSREGFLFFFIFIFSVQPVYECVCTCLLAFLLKGF